jgi:hypothetical protein
MKPLFSSVAVVLSAFAVQAQAQAPGSSSITQPANFPAALFTSYYLTPAPTQEPQPAISDSVLGIVYPFNLTNPRDIPDVDDDPIYYPQPTAVVTNGTAVVQAAIAQINGIIAGSGANCAKCKAALQVGQNVAKLVPSMVPDAMVALCEATKFASNTSCVEKYAAANFGAIWTQVLYFADVGGMDGQYICNSLGSFCPTPYTLPSNTTGLFPKSKPANAKAPAPGRKRVKVLHLSDFHLDPRYGVGAEANCSSGLCCRYGNPNSSSKNQTLLPAPLYGAYKCDTPYYLGESALEAIAPLTGTTHYNTCESDSFAWSIYTGDLVSHDSQNQLSRAYTEYAETSIYEQLKYFIPSGPIFPVLGNHDSNPEAIDAPHSLSGPLGQQQSWNYDHVAGLWQQNGWISAAGAAEARVHYAAYSINHPVYPRLRIITLNTDFWYHSNFLNFINTTNPDNSGSLKWMVGELQDAEDKGERVWILGHVLTGWDGSNPIPNPTDLFYQIVERYSPHVIANIFFGHTHEDEFMIYYANNGTTPSASTALATGWIGPSVTPLTNLNSGFRMYEVDTVSFEIMEAYTFYSDVDSFPSIAETTSAGPVWKFEYRTRTTYPVAGGWPANAPLNATWWHKVTEAMEANHTLVSIHNTYQGKSSVKSPNCTSNACAAAKVCYMRSGSVALGKSCPPG